MKWLDYTALTLTIIGAIIWGLIGLFQFNPLAFLFGETSIFTRIIYDLVGLSGIYMFTMYGKINQSPD
ncbi:MAG: DUF378 domain-containing protein [Eubacterium sp.]|nr:DUF378 domain-containing protein [Eubacterium sp.]